jgi:hypothetical protein
MLNVSAANNNRAGSFNGYSLSTCEDFQKEIVDPPLRNSAVSTLAKILCKDCEKQKV